MKLLTILVILFTIPIPHPTITRTIHVVYAQPAGEIFTNDEIIAAQSNIQDAINYWQELSPITTTLEIISTQLITTEYDVLSDPSMVLQLDSVQFAVESLPIVVIDNSNSGRYIYGNNVGVASYAAIYVVSNAGAATYTHEMGHALYNLPHQYQSAVDIMSLDPYVAYQRHTIGCESLQILGKPCQRIYLPIINIP